MMDAWTDPLARSEAKRRIRAILVEGDVVFTTHALHEMKNDRISQAQVIDVLRGGIVEPPEFEKRSWRYRVRAHKVYVVVAFRSEWSALVATAWRTNR